MNKETIIAPHTQFTLVRSSDEEKMRIDQYLTQQFPLYSRSFFKKLIDFFSINNIKLCSLNNSNIIFNEI